MSQDHANLLSNSACEVHRRASLLECETGPTVFDWALAALAGCGGSVALRFAIDARTPDELLPALLLLLGSLFGAWRIQRRMSAAGRVVLHRDTRELVRIGPRGERRWSFAQIRRIEIREDGFEIRPDLFPENPRWLEVELTDGTILHIAKGGEDELRPVVQALELWQFRAAPSVAKL